MTKKAIIIGAGPGGLTAAYEFLKKTDVVPIIFEESGDIGGISKTVKYKGNRIDIGGHRFFSKSDQIMKWWEDILPIQGTSDVDKTEVEVKYHGKTRAVTVKPSGPDPEKEDEVMLIRHRLSRIYYLQNFFDYPVALNARTIKNLGFYRIMQCGLSYLKARLFPIKHEKSLEDFFINRFGKQLYLTFFKDYTEKVWGVNCKDISAEWGAQRIKGLSITKALRHAVSSFLSRNKKTDIAQKNTETSLIESFLYPKYGPGQMWETVGKKVLKDGGKINYYKQAVGFVNKDNKIIGVKIKDMKTGTVVRTHRKRN